MTYKHPHLRDFIYNIIPNFDSKDQSISALVQLNLSYTDTRKYKAILKDLKEFKISNPTDEDMVRIWRENNQVIGFRNVTPLRELFDQVENQIEERMK